MDRRTFLKWNTAGLGALALSPLMGACASDDKKSSGGPRIALSHPGAAAGIVAVVAEIARKRTVQLGGSFTIGAMANPTVEAQITMIDGWITQGYDAIEVFPMDVVALAPLQAKAQERGIKWISYLVTMEGSDATVGPSPEAQGQLLATGLLDWVKATGKGSKALILDYTPLTTARPRVQLAADACKGAGIAIVSTQDSVDPVTSQEITANTLRAHPDLDVVLCITDDAAVGALNAFEAAGKKPADCFIGGNDGTKEALTALKAGGCYKASAAFNMDDFGRQIADVAFGLVKGEDVPGPVQPKLLTPTDTKSIDEFLAAFDGA